jgi:hypothetical protein
VSPLAWMARSQSMAWTPCRLQQAPVQQFLLLLAADPPGVAAQVGGLGQAGQAEGER